MATMCKLATMMQTHMRLKRNIMLSPLNLNTIAFFSTTTQRSTTTSGNFAKQKDSVDDEPVLSSPCLILPQNEAINETYQARTFLGRCFYDLGKKRFLPAPEEHHSGMIKSEEEKNMVPSADARCIGSSHGWLAFFNPRNCSIYLMNPLTLGTIPLPPLDTLLDLYVEPCTKKSRNCNRTSSASLFRCLERGSKDGCLPKHSSGRYLKKIVLSSPPDAADCDSTDCKVFLSCEGHWNVSVAFCRVGDKKWTKLDVIPTNPVSDHIIYSNKNKKLYGARDDISYESGTGEIYEWDVDAGTDDDEYTVLEASISYPEVEKVNDLEMDLRNNGNLLIYNYLVESSSGEILLVSRHQADHVADGDVILSCKEDPCYEFPTKTIRFDVYKLDPVKKKLKYVKNLGDQALFVGINHSFSLSASQFPEIKPNSIYFTDHPNNMEHFEEDYVEHYGKSCGYIRGDFGIFSLDDNTITPCYHTETKKFSPVPIWLEPPRPVRF